MTQTLSLTEARHIVLSAQGFGAKRTFSNSGWPRLAQCIARMGLLQIDSINVLIRSHYLPLFSRVGYYDRSLLDSRAFGVGRRQLFEYWGHEASLLPLDMQPLLRWRMVRALRLEGIYGQIARLVREHPGYIEQVLAEISTRGPLTARDLGVKKQKTAMWEWHEGKIALEYLFWSGQVTTAARRGFERVYDLTERVLPRHIIDLPTPAEADAQRELVRVAAVACGVATAADLRDYFRLPAVAVRRAIAELIETGDLVPVQVENWKQSAYLDAHALHPRQIRATALLTPFDPLIWERSRVQRLFGFHYRIEIYKPQSQRQYGYYVLPFLCDGRLRARVDLKADRAAGILQVLGVYGEAGEKTPGRIIQALTDELRRLAGWLELERIQIKMRGDLAGDLRGSCLRPDRMIDPG